MAAADSDNLRKCSKLLADEYTLRILAATLIRPKSVEDICVQYDIPIAAGYRRVRSLLQLGLLRHVATVMSRRGKRVKIYKSNVRHISVFFDRGKLCVSLDLAENEEVLKDGWDVLNGRKLTEKELV